MSYYTFVQSPAGELQWTSALLHIWNPYFQINLATMDLGSKSSIDETMIIVTSKMHVCMYTVYFIVLRTFLCVVHRTYIYCVCV